MTSSNRILFITTTSPAVNPRLRKEMLAAMQEGYQCRLLYFHLGIWADSHSQEWVKRNAIKARIINPTKKQFIPWFIFSSIQKAAQVFYPLFHRFTALNAYASDKRSLFLQLALHQYPQHPDFIVAHNPGALYPAYRYARRLRIPFAFDVEDYHPGERVHDPKGYEKQRREHLLKTLLPHAAFVSYASPLIGEYTLRLMDKPLHRHVLLNNAFPAAEFIPPKPVAHARLQLVWFSQNIDFGRGLEQVIMAAIPYQTQLEITLIGHAREPFRQYWLEPHNHFVHYREPLSQEQLHKQLSSYDVGLAAEISSADINKNIALSNKIFAYAQAGLYVLATDTDGQKLFMQRHPALGQICGQDTAGFAQALEGLIHRKDQLRQTAGERYAYARSLAWEEEAPKFLRHVQEALPKNQ